MVVNRSPFFFCLVSCSILVFFPIRTEEDWLSVANWEISRAVRVLPCNRGQKGGKLKRHRNFGSIVNVTFTNVATIPQHR